MAYDDVDDLFSDEYRRWDAAAGDRVPMSIGEALCVLLEPDPPPAVRCPCGAAAVVHGRRYGFRVPATPDDLACVRCVAGRLPA